MPFPLLIQHLLPPKYRHLRLSYPHGLDWLWVDCRPTSVAFVLEFSLGHIESAETLGDPSLESLVGVGDALLVSAQALQVEAGNHGHILSLGIVLPEE